MPSPADRTPAVSVVVISDYASGGDVAWNGFRATFAALARQDFAGSVEFVIGESAGFEHEIPDDVRTLAANLRFVFVDSGDAYTLKNAAVRAAVSDLVAIVDADCIPEPAWLRLLVDAMRRHPDALAVSGRTVYEGRSLRDRVLTLLSRSYLDPGRLAPTRFISPNNSCFRRTAYLRHPLPENLGPFTVRVQSEAMWRDGGLMLFEPRARVVHDFTGWSMERDIRKNVGYGTVATRRKTAALPHAWLVRLGPWSIPLFLAGKTFNSFQDCFRRARDYGVRWYEMPAALALAVAVNLLEIPGMLTAFRGGRVTNTQFR